MDCGSVHSKRVNVFFFLQDKEDKIIIRYLNILKIYYTFPI